MEDDERPTEVIAAQVPADTEDTARDARLGPGTEVAGYVIDGEIGRGGMGFVYSATHPVIGKRAAIKVLKPEVSRNPTVVERFIQEARAVNQIGHPNIIDIFAFGALDDGRAYHVMDLLVGESLRKRLKRGPLHPSEAASVIDETALALTAAHDKGFVHRDLKPDNIFLQAREDRWPEVKLLDFGLAKLMPEAGVAPFQTRTGVVLGTPEYMSPEQARGEPVDHRTDIYALGIVMFEVLAGRRPFPSTGDALATLRAHAEQPAPSLAAHAPALPVEMIQLVDAMLSKQPEDRPSLAAVRTVIKRLRTTKLPTHTAALELSRPGIRAAPPEPAPELGITTSGVGADPLVAELETNLRPPARSPSQPPVSRPPSQPTPSAPPTSAPRTSPPRPADEPRRPSYPAGAFVIGTDPGTSQPPGGTSPARRPSYPPAASLPPQSLHPPAPSTHGGRGARAGSVPPPAPQETLTGLAPAKPVATAARAAPRTSKLWLLAGALLAIVAGVTVALVVGGVI